MHQQQYRSKSLIGLQRVLLPRHRICLILFYGVRQCKCRYIYSVVPCGCGKIFKVALVMLSSIFPSYYFWKMGENLVVISEWTFADTEGWLSLSSSTSKGRLRPNIFLLCVHIWGHFFRLLSVSLGKYHKKPMLNELRLYAAGKHNKRRMMANFFSTFKFMLD